MTQFLNGRSEAAHHLSRFLDGHVTIKKTDDPAKLDYLLHEKPNNPIAQVMLDSTIDLIHHYSYQWMASGKEPAWPAMRKNCVRYIEMRKKKGG